MKHLICSAFAGTALLFVLAGCFGGTSITKMEAVPPGEVFNNRHVIGVVKAENRGAFLFNCIPLWTGKPYAPNYRSYAMFRNYLKSGYMDEMLAEEARIHDAQKVAVFSLSEYSSGWFSLWLVWNRQMRAEGLALGPPVSGAEKDEQ